jgi:hypothetical protein
MVRPDVCETGDTREIIKESEVLHRDSRQSFCGNKSPHDRGLWNTVSVIPETVPTRCSKQDIEAMTIQIHTISYPPAQNIHS